MGFLAELRVWCAESGSCWNLHAGLSRMLAARRRACWLIFAAGVFLPGCWADPGPPKAQTPSYRGITLKVGAVDDAGILTGVSLLRGEWEASRGGQIAMVEDLVAAKAPLAADVVIFSGQRLGDLVDADALAIIPNSAVLPAKPAESEPGERAKPEGSTASDQGTDALQYMDFVPAFREQVSCYGEDRMALPLGATALVLAYRRDAFENEANRAAAQAAGIELKPPRTWSDLDALARFFNGRDRSGAGGKPQHGIVLAMGAGGADVESIGDSAFLARAASLGQHRDHFSFLFDSVTFTPRIDSPPFVEALKGFVAWKKLGPPGVEAFDAAAARKAFRDGQAAMLIDRAEQVGTWSGGKPVGVASLPGSERVYDPLRKEWAESSPLNRPSYLPRGGGWLIGIGKHIEGTQREAALDFAKYLAGPDNLNRLRAERSFPMLPVRTSQLGHGLPDPTAAPDVDSRQWTIAVSDTLRLERVVPGLRVHGAADYLLDLSKGRLAALSGEAPEKALQAVARAQSQRTGALGRNRQLWHYRRSLNKLVTMPRPPEPGK
jgi:multiple sugar transport system substrate-binding protein